jgi:hypothetical protein
MAHPRMTHQDLSDHLAVAERDQLSRSSSTDCNGSYESLPQARTRPSRYSRAGT